ncbi:DEAD/DEAH box helicase [Arthrobacter sp. A2-55]|uniref:DEAD/DEAH box helicase n=1 Tax=Arthrobacter sp. A2-55 TaxID=2897337 RepID=UPI0021CD3C95|nr:DEAD/DEAH box helicase family protein [Arthrobacter sp. A2-55]MCU6480544.1 DEAD/DEAH box helicase family protein [Arthrobacter sp. A2-55]
MKFTLADYQAEVSTRALREVREAMDRYRGDSTRLSAVGVTAPTGAGKTVIAASMLENLYFGSATEPSNRPLTVLWVTDNADLNEQSKEKIEAASDQITGQMLQTVDSQFDQRTFDTGMVYFLNVQKLGSGATKHVKIGDSRRYSLWETIGRTIEERGADFLIVIDEAHRRSGEAESKKPTILRRIIDGARIEVKDENGVIRVVFNQPTPVIVGISATPQKFNEAMKDNKVQRTLATVVADEEKVRASGLIKARIDVNYTVDDQSTDDTLVREAVRVLSRFDQLWEAQRIASEGRDDVKPLLVVQVPDKVSAAKIGEIVQSMTETWDGFDHPDSIAHAFSETPSIEVTTTKNGLKFTRSISHMAPQDVTKDHRVRAVIFKTALTTGWDCPRAEVMVSLRSAVEFTAIAQLIGRMVRTPLARSVDEPGFEDLNSVTLYLPRYKADEVAKVVSSFVDDETIKTGVVINPITIGRNPTVPDEVFDLANRLPKELKPLRRYHNNVSRLVALAVKLDNYGVTSPSGEDFSDEAEALLVGVMDAEYRRLKVSLDEIAKSLLVASFATKTYETLAGTEMAVTAQSVATSVNNLAELQRESARKLPDAVAAWTERDLLGAGMEEREIIVRIAAMARTESVHHALEKESERLIASWQTQIGSEVSLLSAKQQQELNTIWHPAGKPQLDVLALPDTIKVRTKKVAADKASVKDLPLWPKHLYATAKGTFPEDPTSWEEGVLKSELQRESLLGWYRNPPSPANGLSVSYTQQDVDKSLYPDLVFFHTTEDGIAVDIVDPHNHALGDTSAKWAALARFAQEQDGVFRRVSIVIKNKAGQLKAINLAGQATDKLHDEILAASNLEDFEALFETHGSNY